MYSMVSTLKTDYTFHAQYRQLHCSHPQRNSLPMHINMHSTPSTTYNPLLSTTFLCTQLTNTKDSWQNGTRCRDGVKLLWCHSHLVWLVFVGSIPTRACFHSFCDFSLYQSLSKITNLNYLPCISTENAALLHFLRKS